MRKIVFRGKVLDSQEWVYGSLEVFSDDNQQYARIKFDEPYTDEELGITIPVGHDYLVDPETVGQFIGVYDKNGKEVYEGDIVDCWSEGRHCTNGIVKWMQNRIWIASIWDIWNLMPNENGIDEGLIVVGNIYDGKEETK